MPPSDTTGRRPTVFQGFWHGPPLGPLRSACLASFVALGHRYELYVYEPVQVPAGVVLRDANEIIPQGEVFYYDNEVIGKPDIGPFSDLFRFKLLLERGGWWSDVDAICLSPEIPAFDRAWAQEKPEFAPTAIGTSQIAFARGDKVVAELYRRCQQMSRSNYPTRESLGPKNISDTIKDLGLPPNYNGTPALFYPVRWIEMFKLWLPQYRGEMLERAKAAFFMPIYNSFPQYMGLEFGRLPPEGSYLSDICYRYYDGSQRNWRRYGSDEIARAVAAYFLANRDWAMAELRAVSNVASLQRIGLGSALSSLG